MFGVALFALGCGHVSHDELRSELGRSQNELRQEMAAGDVGSLECSLVAPVHGQASMFCDRLNAYCNVVQAYETHCLRESEDGTLLPPLPGVGEAVDRAVEEFNASMTQTSQTERNESSETTETTE